MRTFLFLVAAAVLLLAPIAAQAEVTPEIRPFVGAFIPTGDQRDVLDAAIITGAQVGVETLDMLHVVGTFGFSGPTYGDEVPAGGRMHVYAADIGAEMFRSMLLDNDWELRPFVGLGGGTRTYDPTGSKGSKTYPAGYAALGTELQMDRFALRFEARDYLTRFKGFDGNADATTRNEVVLSAGLAVHIW